MRGVPATEVVAHREEWLSRCRTKGSLTDRRSFDGHRDWLQECPVSDRTTGRLERSSCRGLDGGQGQSLTTSRRSSYGDRQRVERACHQGVPRFTHVGLPTRGAAARDQLMCGCPLPTEHHSRLLSASAGGLHIQALVPGWPGPSVSVPARTTPIESGSQRAAAKVRSSPIVELGVYLGAVDAPSGNRSALIDATSPALAPLAPLTPLLATTTCWTPTTDQPS